MRTTRPSMSTWAGPEPCARTWTRHNRLAFAMAIEFGERIRRIPSYPLAAGYDLGADMAMLASNESCFAPAPGVVEAAQRVLSGVHRYPDPAYAPLRQALADRYGIARERIALGNG